MSEVIDSCRVVPMPGPFGARIEGVDVTTLRDPAALVEIARALRDHHVLVIPGQRLTAESYAAFGRLWGRPIDFFDLDYCLDGNPNMLLIDNREDCPAYKRDNSLHWHVDSTYEDPPVSVTMLYGVECPEIGNETLFADMVAAYEALSDEMKARIEDLVVDHGMGDPRLFIGDEKRGNDRAGGVIPPVQIRPTVQYPLVRRHPQTNRKVLYAPTGSPFGIVGMDTDEAIALLRELKIHALQPRFAQAARADVGSILIWDNNAVMHSATPTRYSNKDGERRLVYGIRTRDVYELPN